MNSSERKYALRAVPGFYSTHPGIQVAAQTNDEVTDEDLQFYQQMGVEWIMLGIQDESKHGVEYYKSLVKRLGGFGLQIYRISDHRVHNVPEITLNLPGRDEKVEDLCTFIRNIGAAGIHYHTYAHMGNGIWSSGRTAGRGGMDARRLDIKEAVGRWGSETYESGLTHGRKYTEDELWENYEYMIATVAPVAERAGVYIGIHPDDPPVYPLGGIPRCMFGNFEGYKRAMDVADSPNIGVCLCVGCWLEGGKQGMGATVEEAIHYFGQRKKLFKIHFRNVSNPMPEPWHETLIDDGYQDMHQVMRALREVEYDGAIIPDHVPDLLGGKRVGESYSLAYIRALAQAVNNEYGGVK